MNGGLGPRSVAEMDPHSALRLALCVSDVGVAQDALARGADVNVRHHSLLGETALLTAIGKGSYRMVELLLRRGADVHQAGSGTGDWQRVRGLTPLMVAAARGLLDIAILLLRAGARPGDTSLVAHGEGQPGTVFSAASLAEISGHTQLAALLRDLHTNWQFQEMKEELDCAVTLVQLAAAAVRA